MKINNQILIFLFVLVIGLPVNVKSQETSQNVNSFSKGDILASLNFGYTGSERSDGYNSEFEKSFKRFNLNLESFIFVTNRIGLGVDIGSENLERRFEVPSNSGFDVSYRETNALTYSVLLGYYIPTNLMDMNVTTYFQGGYIGIQEENWSINNDYSGYVISTGLLYSVSKTTFLNLKLKRIAYQREYLINVIEGESILVYNSKEWPTNVSLSIGLTVKF